MSAASKLHVKSRALHFWRAGIKFTRAGVDVDTNTLTAEQLDAIRAERNLIVTERIASEGGAQGRNPTNPLPPSNPISEGKSPRGDDQPPTAPTPAKPTKAKAKR